MDLLLSRFNHKLDKFVTRTRESWAFIMDALMTLWGEPKGLFLKVVSACLL